MACSPPAAQQDRDLPEGPELGAADDVDIQQSGIPPREQDEGASSSLPPAAEPIEGTESGLGQSVSRPAPRRNPKRERRKPQRYL